VTLELTPRARLLLAVALILAIAGGGLMVFTRLHKSSDSTAPSASRVTPPHRTSSTSTAAKHAAAARPKPKSTVKAKATATSRPAKAKPRPAARPKPTPAVPAPPGQLPAAIRRALAANRVVVVALYDPKATIGGTALREARAGARLAGSSFVAIDVRKHAVDSLNTTYGVVEDPALLVLRPPGDLVVRIDGFADRDTVAQAAYDAAST
jgi:hypothetical protein